MQSEFDCIQGYMRPGNAFNWIIKGAVSLLLDVSRPHRTTDNLRLGDDVTSGEYYLRSSMGRLDDRFVSEICC